MKRISFVDFCARVLRLELTNHQRVLALVAIDGVDPVRLDGSDRAIALELFGDVDDVPPHARRVQAWSLGRGSGKTTLAASLMLYATVTSDLRRCGPGMTPAAVALAPRQSTARLVIGVARALVRNVPELERLVVRGDDTKEGFSLNRETRVARIAAYAASRGGVNVRGFDLLALVLDEAELFQSETDFVVTDRESFNGAIPRLLHGAGHHAILISTPWPTPTLMGELFAKNWGNPTTALAAFGTSLAMHDYDPSLAACIERERADDPENTARERDCSRDAGGSTNFLDSDTVDASVDPDLLLPAPHDGDALGFGGDIGLVIDSTTLAGVSRRGAAHKVVVLTEQRPTKGSPLRLSQAIAQWSDDLEPYRDITREVAVDGHAREPAREYAQANELNLVDAPAGQNAKADTFVQMRKLFREQRIVIPDHARLRAQLKSVIAKSTPGGGLKIIQARRKGLAHGDLVSALVLALHQVSGDHAADYVGFVQRMRELGHCE